MDVTIHFSSETPTEPGLYLFLGIRDVSSPASGLQVSLEIVRVSRTERGLQFIGNDFFWGGVRVAAGLWAAVDPSLAPIRAAAQELGARAIALLAAQAAFAGEGADPRWGPKNAVELDSYRLQQRIPAGLGGEREAVFALMQKHGVIQQVDPKSSGWSARWTLVPPTDTRSR